MRRLAILSAALGFVLGTLSTASAKEFIQFECGEYASGLSSIDNIDATDPAASAAIHAGSGSQYTCAFALKRLFAIGYKLSGMTPRVLAAT